MRTSLLPTLALSGLGFTNALQYGYNHVSIGRDPDELAASFPEPDVKLYSPAFMQPESVPETFVEGTDGPTDDATLGMYFCNAVLL